MSALSYYEDNPPETWEECGSCGGYHPCAPLPTQARDLAAYDCRNDLTRWPSKQAIAALAAKPLPKDLPHITRR